MSRPSHVVDALELARRPVDAAALRDDTPLLALLDLRGTPPQGFNERYSPLERVGEAVAKRLAAGHDIRLIASTGLLEPAWSASVLGTVLVEHGQDKAPVAVIRGEGVSHALEEWHNGGEALRDAESGERLFDSEAETVEGYAPAPPVAIQAALAAGARVVLSAFAHTNEAVRAADDTTAALPERHPVVVWLIDRYQLSACVPLSSASESQAAASATLRYANEVGASCKASVHEAHHGESLLVIDAHAPDRVSLYRLASLVTELVARGDGRVAEGSPLWRQVRRVLRPWHTDVAADLLEFGHDLRPAREWLDASPTSNDA